MTNIRYGKELKRGQGSFQEREKVDYVCLWGFYSFHTPVVSTWSSACPVQH